MRVLFVSQRLPPEHVSGAPLQALRLARALSDRGDVEVTVLTARSTSKLRSGLLDVDGVRVHRLAAIPGVRASYAALAAAFTARGGFDLIHGHALSATTLGAAFAARVPVLLKPSLGGPTGDLARIRRSSLAPLLLRVLARADGFAIIEPSIGDELRAVGVPASKLITAKNGVDLARFRPEGAKAELGVRRRVVLYVGRGIARKRTDLLLGACRRLDALLVIAGEGSASGDGVLALGVRTDVDAIMRAADVLVVPSEQEGMSNVMLEAIACGIPVVSTVSPPTDLAAAVRTVDADEASIAAGILDAFALGHRRPPAAIEAYGIEVVAREYRAIYQRLLELR